MTAAPIHRRRSAIRLSLLAALLAAAAACDGSRAPRDSPRIENEDVELQIGVGNVLDRQGWNLVRLRVKNRGGNFRGTIEVTGRSDYAPAARLPIYRTEAEVPGGSPVQREIAFPAWIARWERVEVTFRQPGFDRRFRLEPLWSDAGSFWPDREQATRLLAVGDRTPSLSAVQQEIQRLLPAKRDDDGVKKPRVKVAAVLPRDLPAHWIAYRPYQAVLLFGVSFDDSPAGALEALSHWVESGGTLIAFPGPGWASGLPPAVQKLLGARLGDPNASLPGALAARVGPAAARGVYRALSPDEGAVEVAGGLAIRSARGAGHVTTFTFGPQDPAFPGRSDSPGLHEALDPVLERSVSTVGNPDPHLEAKESTAAGLLFAMSGFHVPARSSVVIGLLLYLLLGFLLPGTLFRLLRRPEWTYAAVIIASGVFTFAIYRYGLLSARPRTELSEVTVLRLHEGGRSAEATSYIGLMAPGIDRIDLYPWAAGSPAPADHPLAGALPRAFRPDPSDTREPSALLLDEQINVAADRAGRLRWPVITLHPNEMKYFRFDYRVPAEVIDRLALPAGPWKSLPTQLPMGLAGFEWTQVATPVFPDDRIARRGALVLVLREKPLEE